MSKKRFSGSIAVLGCGWLGLPLGKRLIQRGYTIKGSTTSPEKPPLLSSEGIGAFLLEVSSEGISGEIDAFLAEVDVLIIDIPPGLRKNPENDFSGAVRKLSEAIVGSGVKKVIFVSSISVYEETESFSIYSEDTAPNATSRAGKQMIAAEKILIQNSFFETTVIRFGGLIGTGRHPVKYLAGRKNLQNPLGPVNLIHQEDCIGIVESILEKDIFGTIYNAVYPLNPPKEKYYNKKAQELDLEPPQFDHSKPSVGKVISASKLMRELEYDFQEGI